MLLPHLSLPQACQSIHEGKVIIFPTETFYGIGCNALNPDAVGAVFNAKKRALSLPLPVIIGNTEQLSLLVETIPDLALQLMTTFWPGPLSLVLPAKKNVPDLLTANQGRIAVRLSSHPVAQELCLTTGLPLVASSANVSGTPPVDTPTALDPMLYSHVSGLYDAPPKPQGGLSSTIIDIVLTKNKEQIRLLREGAVSAQNLEAQGFSLTVASQAQD